MSGYEDIINLPHHVSERHARMSMRDRAAQFSPFAALTGYDAAIEETARLTDGRMELTEEEKALLDVKLRKAAETQETVCIMYFVADEKKTGGTYIDVVGKVTKIDMNQSVVSMGERASIPIVDIVEIDFTNKAF